MRDVRISAEVLAALTPDKVRALRAGPEPGRTQCVRCEQIADADLDPISVVVIRHPTPGGGTVTNIVFAHAECSPSTLSDSDVPVDVEQVMTRMHLIPTLAHRQPNGPVITGLLMEPLIPIVEAVEAPANAYLQTFLSHGLPLLGPYDVDMEYLATVPDWRAVLAPGESPEETRVTILCERPGEEHQPLAVISDLVVRPGPQWRQAAAATGELALYAGLIGLRQTRDRDMMTVARAIFAAARAGNLCGGLITAAVISP
ncbi:hypothetical protein [Planomonospora sp. ID82291]|uniref:hypothetical protein n=1 Tax=Planomonospora sp. ID82291 TaxID=2738136 RepID=UPI0018C425E7|nr:hypothetical protein [Planomonospora sp. ID82291]MBG0818415.1 hypothetical protein [Planomonospora sp. ID82291]